MARKPGDHPGMFVGGIVVEDNAGGVSGRHGFLDGIDEADELLIAMALLAPSDHLAPQHVEGRKQRGVAGTLEVMGHGAGAALLHRQARLSAVEAPESGSSRRPTEPQHGPAGPHRCRRFRAPLLRTVGRSRARRCGGDLAEAYASAR